MSAPLQHPAAMKLIQTALLAVGLSAGAIMTLANDTLHCKVATVHDGDSMRIQCPGKRGTERLRMSQIDAPELEQAYGHQARDQLRRLCPRNAAVTIRDPDRDQYGRLLGNVYCEGKSVNEEMVGSGAAWVYGRHVNERDRNKLYRLQDQARQQQRGLWADSQAQAPWQWRYHNQTRH